MEQQFSNRSAQQTQPQHVYSNPPYTVYASQPSYISASYQAAAQPQQINYQQSTNRYTSTRQIVTNQNLSAQTPTSNQLTQRRIANTVGSTGANNMLSQGGTLSGVPSHQRFSSASETSHAISATPIHAFSTFTSHNRQIPAELPLRMVVDAKYVGAIIGQGGSSIREITRESKARCVVDAQKAVRDPLGNAEKVISILGQPESCSRACMRILEVVRREMEKDGSLRNCNDYELKLRAHNQLVGRLIGKGGATIKRIMEETGAVVFVSNDPATSRDSGLTPAYATAIYPPEITLFTERTITIKGQDINTVFAAEQKISQKLRQSYESDLNSRTVYSYGQASGGALPLMSPLGCPDPSAFLSTTDSSASAHITRLGASAPLGTLPVSNQQMHTVRMWVPNTIVGALIGPKGINIRNVMRITGAHVRIEGGSNRDRKSKTDVSVADAEASDALVEKKEKSEEPQIEITTNELLVDEKSTEKKDNVENEEVSKSNAPKEYGRDKEGVRDLHPDERLVIITGNEPQQYKAQYWIHQRVAEQTYTYPDSLRLCTEVSVPSKIVGRIVGKGGQNVRELQRTTGAQVKIPEDSGEVESHDTTIVRVLGNFRASQAVQARLSQLTRDFADKLTLWSSNGQTSGRQGTQRDSMGGNNDLSSNGAKSMEFNSRS